MPVRRKKTFWRTETATTFGESMSWQELMHVKVANALPELHRSYAQLSRVELSSVYDNTTQVYLNEDL
jgi:hypothetical protein